MRNAKFLEREYIRELAREAHGEYWEVFLIFILPLIIYIRF
jgi:hypothetical protein